jgi:putative aldouronate transport system substrate-binding protein
MYTEGLIDMEVTTHSPERFQEKFENGQVASYQSPKVPGKTKQALSYVNPYPGQDIFIPNDTKHLNAVMNYLEWVREPLY